MNRLRMLVMWVCAVGLITAPTIAVAQSSDDEELAQSARDARVIDDTPVEPMDWGRINSELLDIVREIYGDLPDFPNELDEVDQDLLLDAIREARTRLGLDQEPPPEDEGGGDFNLISNCCVNNGTAGCDCADCQTVVCSADPFCCNVSWDNACADGAGNLCGVLCIEGSCNFASVCLNNACFLGPFQGQFCHTAIDCWYCGILVGTIPTHCTSDFDCPSCHSCCSAHDNIGCNVTSCQSCVCGLDPFCCTNSWDGACGQCASGTGGLGNCSTGNNCLGSCPQCEVCGNGICAPSEDCTCSDCPCPVGQECSGGNCVSACGNGSCEGFQNEDCFSCPSDCGDCCPGTGDCCNINGNGTVSCNNESCCGCVCAFDPFCCLVSWDSNCAQVALKENFCLGSCQQCAPPNDLCANAIEVFDGTTAFNNQGASTDGPTQCDGVTLKKDVWFEYEATCSGVVTIDTCSGSTSFNTVISLYDGIACPVGDELECNNDAGAECSNANHSLIERFVVQGDIVKIQIGGKGNFNNSSGPGELNISCEPKCGLEEFGDCCDVDNGTPGCNLGACCAAVCFDEPSCCEVVWDQFCVIETFGRPECDGPDEDDTPDCDFLLNCGEGSGAVEDKMLASDAVDSALFGTSVSLEGQLAVIGAPGGDGNATNSGTAYIRRFDSELGQWVEEDILVAGAGASGDQFGVSVDVSQDIAGAECANECIEGLDGDACAVDDDCDVFVPDNCTLTVNDCIFDSCDLQDNSCVEAIGQSGSNCCMAQTEGSVGCDDAKCEACVCGIDPFCCNENWDDFCAEEAAGPGKLGDCSASCPCGDVLIFVCDFTGSDCDPPTSDCCSAHGALGCDDGTCETSVCAIDASCCVAIGDTCVIDTCDGSGLCVISGEACVEDTDCQSLCHFGGTPCIDDTECPDIDLGWTDTCSVLAAAECGSLCDATCPPAGICSDAPGAVACVEDIDCQNPCVADECLKGVQCLISGATCDPPVSNCCTGGGVGCDDAACETTVCAIDPTCCATGWTQVCADEALISCGTLCDGTCPPVCAVDGADCGDACLPFGTCSLDSAMSCEFDTDCIDPGTCDLSGDSCDETSPVCADFLDQEGICELCGELAIVGAFVSNGGLDGTAHIFRGVDGSWTEEAVLASPSSGIGAAFGVATAISHDGTGVVCEPVCASGLAGSPCTVDADCQDGETPGVCELCGDRAVVGEPGAPISNCCVEHDSPGCDNTTCETCVCGIDPLCCSTAWDEECVEEVQSSVCSASCTCTFGVAHVYHRIGSEWILRQTLSTPLAEEGLFGRSVALHGDVMVIGEAHANTTGSAHVFRMVNNAWVLDNTLTPSDADVNVSDFFGDRVAIRGNLVIVGAPLANTGPEELLVATGAAYVYRFNRGAWTEEAKLIPADGVAGDNFGTSVSIDGTLALVGAHLDGDADTNAGAWYVFRSEETESEGTQWFQDETRSASDVSAGDNFGTSVSLSGVTALIGSPNQSSAGASAGAAYAYRGVGNRGIFGLGDILPPPPEADCIMFEEAVVLLAESVFACVSGPFDKQDCVIDDDCQGGVCLEMSPGTFFMSGVELGNPALPFGAWIANDPGKQITIQWKMLTEGGEDEIVPYDIRDQAGVNTYTTEVKYFRNWQQGETSLQSVLLSTPYHIDQDLIRFNTTIRESIINAATSHIIVTPGSPKSVIVAPDCPIGRVLLQYTDDPGGPLIGFEVLSIEDVQFLPIDDVPIGRNLFNFLEDDGVLEGDYCDAVLRRNGLDPMDPVAFQHPPSALDIYPIRPEGLPNNFNLIWFKPSILPGGLDLQNCWPGQVTRHTSDWPSDPQVSVIDDTFPEFAPAVVLWVGNDPNLGHRYCSADILYEQGLLPSDPVPLSSTASGVFTAQRVGYSVIRFTALEDGVQCGDVSLPVTFEVVRIFDHEDLSIAGYPNAELDPPTPVFDGSPVAVDIGVSLEQPIQHSSSTPLYPFGYLHAGQPYAPNIYLGGDDATGQIFAVNTAAEHGLLEAWYFLPARLLATGRTASGDFAEGIFWPHKMFRYSADWPSSTDPIVIENRNGVGCTGDDCESNGNYPSFTSIYSEGPFSSRVADQFVVPGWNPNDEHAQLMLIGSGGLKVFAVRDDDPWATTTGHPYVLVQYPNEPANPASADEVTEWRMAVHEVIGSDGDPDCAWDGNIGNSDLFNCFIYSGFGEAPGVFAGAPIDPPLFPINFGQPLCVDTFVDNDPSTPPTALFRDRSGLIWAIEDFTDGRDASYPLGTESSSKIFLWENWPGDDLGAPANDTCDPWRDFGTGTPTPITYTPAWPGVPPLDCNFEAGDPNCARPVKVGETISHGVNNQCGTILFLHDSSNAVVVNPLECNTAFLDNLIALGLDFANLPPHIGGGELSGGGPKIPARVEYVAGGSPFEISGDADCGSNLSQQLVFVGIMSERDREFLLALGDRVLDDCYDPIDGSLIGGDGLCEAVDELFTESQAQLGFRCFGGANHREACDPAGGPTECPALCDPQCIGGSNDGQICDPANDDADCEGAEDGICVVICPPGACRRFTQLSPHAISLADASARPGWITIAFANDEVCAPLGPVAVQVWRVECGPDKGRVRVIEADCPFSEQVVLQHTGDAGGSPETLSYQWQFALSPTQPEEESELWTTYGDSGFGAREVTLSGNLSPVFTLLDSWWRMRYRGFDRCQCSDAGASVCLGGVMDGIPCTTNVDCEDSSVSDPDSPHHGTCELLPDCPDWPGFLQDPSINDTAVSDFTRPVLVEGWIKRVIRKFNQFDQRIDSFHSDEITTYVNMIRQAGIRFQGPIALNCDPENINSLGIIETYETVLARAKQFLASGTIPELPVGANLAMLLAGSKISDLYMLLGNEAFADALDPTLGLFVNEANPIPPTYDPQSIFAFQGQVPDLLAEELALLRGQDIIRDLDLDPVTNDIIATVFNRLPWNFTSTDGQVAYANNYQVTAIIDSTGEDGALIRYPQGHGDAWGHYLTATKEFYDLLTSEFFDWVVSTEAVNVAGQPVPVTFQYERKFVAAAAAKARTGAAITSLTFRQQYTSDPTQQTGYFDEDPERAWGVTEWARRSGQGVYLDWVFANSLLDDEDTEHEEGSIQKVDRTTIAELAQLTDAYNEIQSILDTANAGLNPLGIATNVVPFGLNPGAIENGKTHFDQIFERAAKALFNAVKVFEFANENTQRLRSVQDAAENFDELVDQGEAHFNARLIEIFGRPYPEDIGVGGFYRAGYAGPDWIHFDYVEPSKLLGGDGVSLNGNAVTITVSLPWTTIDWNTDADSSDLFENTVAFPCSELSGIEASQLGGVCTGVVSADFNISTDGIGLIKPPGWTQRIEPGKIQLARSELLQALGQYERAIAQYEAHLTAIEVQICTVAQAIQVTGGQLEIINTTNNEVISLNNQILGFRATAQSLRQVATTTRGVAGCLSEGVDFLLVVGLANGTDAPMKIAKGTILCIGEGIASGFDVTALGFELGALSKEQAIEEANNAANLRIATLDGEFLIGNEIGNLVNLIAETPALQLEAYILQEAINAAAGKTRSALGQGMRIFNEREAVRQRAARKVSEYRYQDMAFRIFRNDALQKYRAMFDLAARYAFLAAKAYDYETALLGTDNASGEQFFTGITKERVLGQIEVLGGTLIPQPGPGLAGTLAALSNNFEVLRTELGFNDNAAELERTFSLRWENYRIPNTEPFAADWRQVLSNAVVPDIQQVPEYGLFALPFSFEGEIPGIVLRFETDITTGHNFFGWPSTADELYPTTYFAIKLHKIALRFTGYPGAPLNNQVECYLLPTGSDVMRVPSCSFPRVRYWQLLDQTMPVPFTLTEAQFVDPLWMPWDGVTGGAEAFVQRRLYPTISARPIEDGDELDQSFILTGRSAWNTGWTLIIPGIALEGLDQDEGIDVFINGLDGNGGVEDINLLFTSYGYFGCSPGTDDPGDGDEDEDDGDD